MTYTDFANKMLVALYRESDGDPSAQVAMNTLAQRHGIEVAKPFWVTSLKSEWAQNGWAHFPEDGTGRSETAIISIIGVRQAEAQRLDILPQLNDLKENFGFRDLVEADAIPASDRIVRLNDNQIAEVEPQVSELVRQLENDNGDPNQPGLRERLLGQIKASRELIRAGEFRAYLLFELLVRALNELVEKYGNPAIAALANALLGAVVSKLLVRN